MVSLLVGRVLFFQKFAIDFCGLTDKEFKEFKQIISLNVLKILNFLPFETQKNCRRVIVSKLCIQMHVGDLYQIYKIVF